MPSQAMPVQIDKRNILVVDDEPQITRVLKTTLASQGDGFGLPARRGSRAGDEGMVSGSGDHRPVHAEHGWSRAVPVRSKNSAIPIIVLSVKGEEQIKVEALDSGADHYITKPFSGNQLLARVRAALRRGASGPSDVGGGGVRCRRLSRQYGGPPGSRARQGEVRLTPKEFDLFVYMARHPNRVNPASHPARGGWGERGVAGAAGIPPRLHGPAAEEARRPDPVDTALPRDRAVGRVQIRSRRE